MDTLSRRSLCAHLAGATGLALTATPAMALPLSAAALDTGGPEAAGADEALRRFMKIYAGLTSQTIWYWYSGTLELAPNDAPVTPLANVETLIRRDVTAKADGTFHIRTFEANYFCRLHDRAPVHSMANPLTGRTIAPLHFSEGPRDTIWSALSLAPRKNAGLDSTITVSQAGAYTWLRRELHADFPHPLDLKQWPLEASGTRNRTGSFSTHCALTRDVENPALACAPCSFTYAAVFGWFPWLLMGQTPGQMLWRANGMKLTDLADLPKDARTGFEQTFPTIFTGTGFGPNGVDLWQRFKATRQPASI